MKEVTLGHDVEATMIHGITGRDLENTVLPAGTAVRIVGPGKTLAYSGEETTLISVKHGESWFRYRVLSAQMQDKEG